MNVVLKNLIRFCSLMGLILASAACEPKHESVDERQKQINSANASLARMDVLESELKLAGLSFDTATPLKSIPGQIVTHKESELLLSKQRLEEFISHGQNVLNISTRTDVIWTGRPGLQARVSAAQSLLTQVNRRIAYTDHELGTRFWTTWNSCRVDLQTGFELHGVRVWYNYYSVDGRAIHELRPESRRELAKRVRHQMECHRIVQRGNVALYGENDRSEIRVADAPTRFGKLNPEDRNLEVLASKLGKLE